MSLEIAALAAGAPGLGGEVLNAGYAASLSGPTPFQQALAAVPAGPEPAEPTDAIGAAFRGVFETLENVNGEARALAAHARAAEASGGELSPGEMIMMTVRCHEFLFHCQLTSNVANRTSDGLQQLFRQQG